MTRSAARRLPRAVPLAIAISLVAMGAAANRGSPEQPGPIAIVGATVVPMDGNRLLPDHTVLISGGRITAMGPVGSTAVPAGSRVINAAGRYLVPGLADMHVHLTAEIGARPDFGDGPLFLAAGVTTVLNVRGDSTTLAWRRQVNGGGVVGPTIHTSGEFVNEPRVTTPEEAEREVRAQAAAGYDVIKVREVVDPVRRAVVTTVGMSLETYRELMETARGLRMPVIGHVPANLGYQASIDMGQSWAHLFAILPVARLGDTALARVGAAMRTAGIWVTPTLVVYRADALTGAPEALLVGEEARGGWQRFAENVPPGRPAWAASMVDTLQRATRALHQAGVPLLAGTDALGWPFMVPGSGLHEELRLLGEAGLSPYEVLRTATVEPARFLGKSDEFGTVAVGRRADLVMTAENPLANLATLRHPVGVMARGEWRDSAELRRLVDRIDR